MKFPQIIFRILLVSFYLFAITSAQITIKRSWMGKRLPSDKPLTVEVEDGRPKFQRVASLIFPKRTFTGHNPKPDSTSEYIQLLLSGDDLEKFFGRSKYEADGGAPYDTFPPMDENVHSFNQWGG